MPVRTEPIDKWVRAFVGETAVVDSRSAVLFYEEAFPIPSYAFDPADVRADLLRPSVGEPPQEPFFFLPKGPVAQWFDVKAEGRVLPWAAWIRDDPTIRDNYVLSWQPGKFDRWLEEDEEVAGHPRSPHKRVEALSSSRHIKVVSDGTMLAETANPVLLFETDLPTRYYFPPEDVNLEALESSTNRSHCPYKGVAGQYWDIVSPPGVKNAAWSYANPFPAVGKIAHRIAFYNELVDIIVDGTTQERPISVFSRAANRPGA
ncbi:MAG: DUF427 domain-containing protein [Aeromicrobium sp.]